MYKNYNKYFHAILLFPNITLNFIKLFFTKNAEKTITEILFIVKLMNYYVFMILGAKSYILTGDDAKKIHEENIGKLSNMSADAIINEQNKLMAQLDPALIKFIRSKRQMKCEGVGKEGSTVSPNLHNLVNKSEMETDADGDVAGLSVIDVVSPPVTQSGDADTTAESSKDINIEINFDELGLPITSEEANKWLHMEVVEKDKLKWIGDLPSPPPLPANTPYSARFDFQGMIIQYI